MSGRMTEEDIRRVIAHHENEIGKLRAAFSDQDRDIRAMRRFVEYVCNQHPVIVKDYTTVMDMKDRMHRAPAWLNPGAAGANR